MLGDVCDHRAKVLEIDEQPSVVVRYAECDRKHALLYVGQPQKPRKQVGTEIGNGRADGMPAFAVNIPEAHRISLHGKALGIDADALQPFFDVHVHFAGLAAAGKIALDVRQEHGDAEVGE